MRYVMLGVLMLAGCSVTGLQDLRMSTRHYSTYQCQIGYDEAYEQLVEGGIKGQVLAVTANDDVPIQHAIYPDARKATIYRVHFVGQAWWVIDITGTDSGCEIRVSGITPARWETAHNIVGTLPDTRMTGCFGIPAEYRAAW